MHVFNRNVYHNKEAFVKNQECPEQLVPAMKAKGYVSVWETLVPAKPVPAPAAPAPKAPASKAENK